MKIADLTCNAATVEIDYEELSGLAAAFRELSQGAGPWNSALMQEYAEVCEECIRVIDETNSDASNDVFGEALYGTVDADGIRRLKD